MEGEGEAVEFLVSPDPVRLDLMEAVSDPPLREREGERERERERGRERGRESGYKHTSMISMCQLIRSKVTSKQVHCPQKLSSFNCAAVNVISKSFPLARVYRISTPF